MFKNLFCVAFSLSTLAGAAMAEPASGGIDSMSTPIVAAERSGVYRVVISKDIAVGVKEALKQAFATEDGSVPAQVEAFDNMTKHAIYPHPSKINSMPQLWSGLRQMLLNLRTEYDLGTFYTTAYTTIEECMGAFKAFVLTQLPGDANAAKRSEIDSKLSERFAELCSCADRQHAAYRTFYETRPNIFSRHAVETYIRSILPLEGEPPMTEFQEGVLSILVAHGFLEIFGDIKDKNFVYSPRAMVEAYIASNGLPATIILGCGHSGVDKMLEFFGLSGESWCGCCEDLPHDGAMVVSLHEPTADILCDLNHPDLWASFPPTSVDGIRDETWSLSFYKPETLGNIVRVLKVGGEFSSNGHAPGCAIKSQMEALGLEVIEEDLEKNILRMRKAR